MCRKLAVLLFFVIFSNRIIAQVLPEEGSALNYRLIGFSFSQSAGAINYKIEVAKGIYKTEDSISFKKNITASAESRSNKIIAEVPLFGVQYTWRVVYYQKNKTVKSSPYYHFRTLTCDNVDTTKLRLKILHPAAKQYKNYYVSEDAGGVLYDMGGQPVWFVPDTNGINGYVGDMKFTPEGTITFLQGKKAYEIDYNANILWQTPNESLLNGIPERGEMYHHEFIKRPNGHYMILGMRMLMSKQIFTPDTNYFVFSSDLQPKEGYVAGRFGTIIEYDQSGNIVWSWQSLDYLQKSDFRYFRGLDPNIRFDPHDNAFYFDEKKQWIYLGFRNLNRIIVIEYPSGKVVRTYGENFTPGAPRNSGTGLFCNQHSISLDRDGNLLVFDNNSCLNVDSLPTLAIFKEPALETDTLKKIWEYRCTIDDGYPQGYPKIFASGGNIVELPDRSLFVCMSSNYPKTFIVNREKQVIWSALPQKYLFTDEKWTAIHEYRANIISRKDLEHMIWAAETKK